MSEDLTQRKRPAHFSSVPQHNRATIYFVTVCVQGRRPVLANEKVSEVLQAVWREAGGFLVGRYVVMPDHLHLFCAPAEFPPTPLGKWMSYWKSLVARRWPGGEGGKLWQRDYWDTQLRQGQSYSEKWEYVRQNPVRAGLVATPEAWRYQGELHGLEWHD